MQRNLCPWFFPVRAGGCPVPETAKVAERDATRSRTRTREHFSTSTQLFLNIMFCKVIDFIHLLFRILLINIVWSHFDVYLFNVYVKKFNTIYWSFVNIWDFFTILIIPVFPLHKKVNQLNALLVGSDPSNGILTYPVLAEDRHFYSRSVRPLLALEPRLHCTSILASTVQSCD